MDNKGRYAYFFKPNVYSESFGISEPVQYGDIFDNLGPWTVRAYKIVDTLSDEMILQREEPKTTNLLQLGDFTLNSGKKSFFKLECDAFTDDDWKCIAELVYNMIGVFSSVEGIPRGGTKLAELLQPYVSGSGPHLIVDDIWTTGGSMQRAWQAKHRANGEPDWISPHNYILGAVVIARGPIEPWVKALFTINHALWLPVERTSE